MNLLKPYFVPALVTVGFALRLVGAAARPLDGDEGVILLAANGPISQLLAVTARDVHPPLFHLLTSAVLAVGGLSALTLRLVSVVAGTLLVALGPALARRLRVSPWLVTGLLATSPFLVYLSQDARMYSLVALLVVASWLTLTKLWEHPDDRRSWVLFGVFGALLVLTHHLGWLVLGAELIATLVVVPRLFAVSYWIGAVVLIIVAYLPLLQTTVSQVTGRLAEQTITLTASDRLVALSGALYRFIAGRTFLDAGPSQLVALAQSEPLRFGGFLISIAALWLVGFGLLRLFQRPTRQRAGWIVFLAVCVLVALTVASISDQAVRYLAFLAPFLLLLLALGLERAWSRWWGRLLALALVSTTIAGLWTQIMVHDRAPGLDAYAVAITAHEEPNDVILIRGSFAGGELAAFQQFYRGPTPVIDLYQDYTVGNLTALRAVRPADRISTLLNQYRRVWFYDQTYAIDPLVGLNPAFGANVRTLGYDKEVQPLKLYLVTRNRLLPK